MKPFRFYILSAILFLCAPAVLTGCSKPYPEDPLPQLGSFNTPKIYTDAETGENYLYLRVLTYNIAALPVPLRFLRDRALAKMALYFDRIQGEDFAPHIVLLQEAFDPAAMRSLVSDSGYVNYVFGPDREAKAPNLPEEYTKGFKRKKYLWSGEKWGKLHHSGLAVLSNLPLHKKYTRPFRYCAGWDCMAAKGVMAVDVEIPGMPGKLLVANTHLNARKASKVPIDRTLTAHNLQVYELKYFAKSVWDKKTPLIFGGDFNIKNKEKRVSHALNVLGSETPYLLPRYYCLQNKDDCHIELDLEGENPWMNTQDIQGFVPSKNIGIKPVKIMAMFDDGPYGQELSDHHGYLVEYELRWKN